MAEGFIKRYLGDLLRFWPLAQDIEIRHESGVEIHSIKSVKKLALTKIPKQLLGRHNIDKTLRLEDKAEKKGEKGDDAAYDMGFNVGEQVIVALNKTNRMERVLIKVREKHPGLGMHIDRVEERFQDGLERGVFIGEKKERGLFLRLLGVVTKVAERRSDDPTVMQTLTQFVKTKEDISWFSRLAFRHASIKTRRAVSGIGREDGRIESIFLKVEHGRVEEEKAAKTLAPLFDHFITDMNTMFENTYKLWRRDFLAELVLLRLLDDTQRLERKSIPAHQAPRGPTEKNIADIENIKKGIAKHAHFLAQEFRILISKEEKVKRNIAIERQLVKRSLAMDRRGVFRKKKIAA